MARTPTPTPRPALLRPAAAPVDTFVQPQRSPLRDLADALGTVDRPLKDFLDQRNEKEKEEARIRGEAAFYENNSVGFEEAVRQGLIPAQSSPHFVRAYKNAQGNVAGHQLKDAFSRAYEAWDGKYQDDADFDGFVADFVRQNVGTEDPDVLRGLLPHVREVQQNGRAAFTSDRHKQVYEGSLAANVAGANRDIEEANAEGLASPSGTDYPAVFAAINEKREAFVGSGGRPEDFDKAMIDAMSAKVLTTKDPGLLAWFDQKIPGKDYTYGEDPYGAKIRKDTIESLEVIARRQFTEDAARQKAKDDAAKDAAHRSAIEILASNPAAEIPDGLLEAGMKVDPTFRVRVEEWRQNLGRGFSDPERVKSVYATILEGNRNAYSIVQEAFTAGVFGRPEDLAAAYSFAKGFEDNRTRIDETLGGTVAKSLAEAIEVRTKGQTKLFEPIAGISNEGAEALYDFRRLVKDWVLNNPDADSLQTEEAVSRIGKVILDRIPEADPAAGSTYERPEEMEERFPNPFTTGTAPMPGTGQQTLATPEDQAGRAIMAEEAQDYLNGLDEADRQGLADTAAALGISEEELASRMLDAETQGQQPQPTTPQASPEAPAQEGSTQPEGPTPWIDIPGLRIGPYIGPGSRWYNPASYNPQDGIRETGGLTSQQAMAILDEAMVETATPVRSAKAKASVPDARAARVLDLIGVHEAAGNYNAVYGKARSKHDLSQYTLDQILARQAAARRRGVASTAIGKYQFIWRTLRGLKAELGLTGKERFTPKLQDQLGMALLKRRGWDAYVSGRMSKRQFALRLSQEWASLPNPNTGRSFYAGDGLNASSASRAQVYRALGFI